MVTYEFFLRRENVVDAGISQLRSVRFFQRKKMVDLQRNIGIRQSPQPLHILVLEDLLRESLRLCEVPVARGHSGPMVSNSPKRVYFILANIPPSRCGCILVSAALCTENSGATYSTIARHTSTALAPSRNFQYSSDVGIPPANREHCSSRVIPR